jgi:hypothetical protein
MTSFINMMANDRWSEADIVNRTEAMIAAEFTPSQVAILNRVATAAALGQYQLTEQEMADIGRYNTVCLAAREAGAAARADMELLAQTLDYETAQQTITRADPEVVALYALRNPAPVAEEEETE